MLDIYDWDKLVTRYFYLKQKSYLSANETEEMQRLAGPVRKFEAEWTQNSKRIKEVCER